MNDGPDTKRPGRLCYLGYRDRKTFPKVYDINLFMESQIIERAGSPLDPRRLKFITQNLALLQGLNFVILGAGLFLSDMRNVWRLPWWAKLLSEALQFGLFIMLGRGIVTKYYEHRFGRVEPKAKSPATRREAIGWLVNILLVVGVLLWGLRLEAWVDATLIGDPSGQVRLLALVFWIMSVAKSIRRDSSMDPRGPFFYLVGLAISAAVALYPKWHPDVNESMLWRTLNTGSVWLTCIALGLRDHFVLVRALPKNGSDDEDDF